MGNDSSCMFFYSFSTLHKLTSYFHVSFFFISVFETTCLLFTSFFASLICLCLCVTLLYCDNLFYLNFSFLFYFNYNNFYYFGLVNMHNFVTICKFMLLMHADVRRWPYEFPMPFRNMRIDWKVQVNKAFGWSTSSR